MRSQDNSQELTQAIRNGFILPERSGQYWSKEEREELAELYYAGTDLSQISLKLERTEMAIVQQLVAMGPMATGAKQSRGEKEPRCLCRKCRMADRCTQANGCIQEDSYARTV